MGTHKTDTVETDDGESVDAKNIENDNDNKDMNLSKTDSPNNHGPNKNISKHDDKICENNKSNTKNDDKNDIVKTIHLDFDKLKIDTPTQNVETCSPNGIRKNPNIPDDSINGAEGPQTNNVIDKDHGDKLSPEAISNLFDQALGLTDSGDKNIGTKEIPMKEVSLDTKTMSNSDIPVAKIVPDKLENHPNLHPVAVKLTNQNDTEDTKQIFKPSSSTDQQSNICFEKTPAIEKYNSSDNKSKLKSKNVEIVSDKEKSSFGKHIVEKFNCITDQHFSENLNPFKIYPLCETKPKNDNKKTTFVNEKSQNNSCNEKRKLSNLDVVLDFYKLKHGFKLGSDNLESSAIDKTKTIAKELVFSSLNEPEIEIYVNNSESDESCDEQLKTGKSTLKRFRVNLMLLENIYAFGETKLKPNSKLYLKLKYISKNAVLFIGHTRYRPSDLDQNYLPISPTELCRRINGIWEYRQINLPHCTNNKSALLSIKMRNKYEAWPFIVFENGSAEIVYLKAIDQNNTFPAGIKTKPNLRKIEFRLICNPQTMFNSIACQNEDNILNNNRISLAAHSLETLSDTTAFGTISTESSDKTAKAKPETPIIFEKHFNVPKSDKLISFGQKSDKPLFGQNSTEEKPESPFLFGKTATTAKVGKPRVFEQNGPKISRASKLNDDKSAIVRNAETLPANALAKTKLTLLYTFLPEFDFETLKVIKIQNEKKCSDPLCDEIKNKHEIPQYIFGAEPLRKCNIIILTLYNFDPTAEFYVGFTSCRPDNLPLCHMPVNPMELELRQARSNETWFLLKFNMSESLSDVREIMIVLEENYYVVETASPDKINLVLDNQFKHWPFFVIKNGPINIGYFILSNMTESEKAKDLANKQKECVVCFELADSALYPCGHYCVCLKCGQNLITDKNLCPICRKHIKDVVKVYFC